MGKPGHAQVFLPSKIATSRSGSRPQSKTWFHLKHGMWVQTTNNISIDSVVFAGLTPHCHYTFQLASRCFSIIALPWFSPLSNTWFLVLTQVDAPVIAGFTNVSNRHTHELCLMVHKSLIGHVLCISDVLTSVLDLHCLLHRLVTSLYHGPVDESVTGLSLLLHHEHGTGGRQSLNCCSWPLLFVTNWRQFCSSLPMDTGKQTDDCFVIHPRSPNKKVMVAHTRLPSVGFWSWSQFLAVSLQVTWVINPAVGFHYFPPGPQLPS